MKKFFRLNILMQALLSIFVACNGSLIAAKSVPAGGSAQYAFQQQCFEVLEAVSAEMGDDTTLGERIMQVYGWVLDGTPKPKQYAKERAAFIKECKNEWKEKLSPAVYAQLEQLNATGKKYAGMAGWKKGLIVAGSFTGLLAIAALKSWDENREKSKKGSGGSGNSQVAASKPGWGAVRPFQSPKPPILGSSLSATGPQMDHASAAAGAGWVVGAGSPGTSVNSESASVNLRARLNDAREFMACINTWGAQFNPSWSAQNLARLVQIAQKGRGINQLFNEPTERGFYENVQATFLSLAAKKGVRCWPVCQQLLGAGARTDIGDPLPAARYRDAVCLTEPVYANTEDSILNSEINNLLSLLQGLSKDQLTTLLHSRSGVASRPYNYLKYCFDKRLLYFFQANGVELTQDIVWGLLDEMMAPYSGISLQRTNDLLRALNSWCQATDVTKQSIRDWLLDFKPEDDRAAEEKALLIYRFFEYDEGHRIAGITGFNIKNTIAQFLNKYYYDVADYLKLSLRSMQPGSRLDDSWYAGADGL